MYEKLSFLSVSFGRLFIQIILFESSCRECIWKGQCGFSTMISPLPRQCAECRNANPVCFTSAGSAVLLCRGALGSVPTSMPACSTHLVQGHRQLPGSWMCSVKTVLTTGSWCTVCLCSLLVQLEILIWYEAPSTMFCMHRPRGVELLAGCSACISHNSTSVQTVA